MTHDQLKERNAIMFGWHVGYYYFVLAIVAKGNADELDSQSAEVLEIVKSRIQELIEFFGIQAEFPYPKSAAEAAALFSEVGSQEKSKTDSSFSDIFEVNFGPHINDFYELGKSLIIYSLVASRSETELQPIKEQMTAQVRRLSTRLQIPIDIVEDLVEHPEKVVNPRNLVDLISRSGEQEEQNATQHIVITLHGIRTHAPWQRRLDTELSMEGLIPVSIGYGFFFALQLLSPRVRRRKVDWFRDEYTAIRERHPNARLSVIAHSFGTYLVANAMRYYPEISFDHIVFCGAIVGPTFPWAEVTANRQVGHVLNEYGGRDIWTATVGRFVPDAGPSGHTGFTKAPANLTQRSYPGFRHSDYFHPLHYQKTWLRFLTGRPLGPQAVKGTPPPNAAYRLTLVILFFALLLLAVLAGTYWRKLHTRVDHAAVVNPSTREFSATFVPDDFSRGCTSRFSTAWDPSHSYGIDTVETIPLSNEQAVWGITLPSMVSGVTYRAHFQISDPDGNMWVDDSHLLKHIEKGHFLETSQGVIWNKDKVRAGIWKFRVEINGFVIQRALRVTSG